MLGLQIISASDDYRQLCIATSQVLVNTLLQPVSEPENINLVHLMQDVGDDLGLKVEVSQGRVWVQARARCYK